MHRITHTRVRPFNSIVVPACCGIVLYLSARLFFFVFLGLGLNGVAAMLVSLFACVVEYFLLLRILGVKLLSYLRRTAVL
ncbi:hypothetical protein LJC42_05980 [Eubacteriales bacterium OttesenSCG-928-K08]|nr:hypothetical protein [Eubacteriales bacterium OttesenSCG-928-K08]